jgi:hypothetical protein
MTDASESRLFMKRAEEDDNNNWAIVRTHPEGAFPYLLVRFLLQDVPSGAIQI